MEIKNKRVWPYTGKLIIFTTFYESRGYAPYIKSLATTIGLLHELGIKHDYWIRSGDFHVERAINDTLTKFINDKEATDLLMIDADEEWKPEDVVRLLTHPEEIVGATYRMKHRWGEYVGHVVRDEATGVPVGKLLPDGTCLVKADRIAAGFIRFKKEALRRFHDHYPELRCKEPDGEMTIFYERALIDGVMHSQDMAFSRKFIEMGGEMWIDPHIHIVHYGLTPYAGNFHEYLKRDHTKEKQAFDTISKMAENLQLSRSAA